MYYIKIIYSISTDCDPEAVEQYCLINQMKYDYSGCNKLQGVPT